MDVPNNTRELFNTYKSYYQKDETSVRFVSTTKLVLIWCVVPALGGPKPKGKRSTQDDIKTAMSFLQGVSLEQLLNSVESVRNFMEEETFPKNKQREHWAYIKKLMNWATEQEYISNQSNIIDNTFANSSFFKEEIKTKAKNLNAYGKQVTQKYTLGWHYVDYVNGDSCYSNYRFW